MSEDLFRIHCRQCGSPLTRPLRERRPGAITSEHVGWFRYGHSIQPSGGKGWLAPIEVVPGDAANAIYFSSGDLASAALPHRYKSAGCCGPEARHGPNLLCHGCGAWALLYNESCYSRHFVAGRLDEIELRPLGAPCPPTRDDGFARDEEHWTRVALEQPGVCAWRDVFDRLILRFLPRFAEAGRGLELWPTHPSEVVKADGETIFEILSIVLEHALEVCRGKVELRLGGHAYQKMVILVCRDAMPEASESRLPAAAHRLAESLGADLSERREFRNLDITLTVPSEPIPLKPVAGPAPVD